MYYVILLSKSSGYHVTKNPCLLELKNIPMMIQRRVDFVFISLFSATCLSQDVTKSKEVKNILSIAAGGTSTTLGITYERILSSRKVSLEIGTGLLLG